MSWGSRVRGAILLALLLAPWWGEPPSTTSGLQVIAATASAVLHSAAWAFEGRATTRVVLTLIFYRRMLLVVACFVGGAATLVLAPHARLPRARFASTLALDAGLASLFVHMTTLFLASEYIASSDTLYLVADVLALAPFVALGVAWWSLWKWNEAAVWIGGALAAFALFSVFDPYLASGVRAAAGLVVINFWREARKWDELPPSEP